MTETYISSAVQIPLSGQPTQLTETSSGEERKGKPRQWCDAPADAHSSEVLRAGQGWWVGYWEGVLMYPGPRTGWLSWSRPWGDGAGLWKLNSALEYFSACAWVSCPKTLQDLSALVLGCQPGPRDHGSDKWTASATLCFSLYVLPDPQFPHKILK